MSWDLWTRRLQIKLFIFVQNIIIQIKIEYLKSDLYFNRHLELKMKIHCDTTKATLKLILNFEDASFRNAERWI